ncbi:MAG: phosphoribosyltransferase family protein [bacterium]
MTASKESVRTIDINQGLGEIQANIHKKHRKKDLVLLGVSEHGYCLAKRLASRLANVYEDPIPVGQLATALYVPYQSHKEDHIRLSSSIVPCSLKNKRVILIDTVLTSGRTVAAALNALSDYDEAQCIELAVLLDTQQTIYPISADYIYQTLSLQEGQYVDCKLYELDGEEKVSIKTTQNV